MIASSKNTIFPLKFFYAYFFILNYFKLLVMYIRFIDDFCRILKRSQRPASQRHQHSNEFFILVRIASHLVDLIFLYLRQSKVERLIVMPKRIL